jgi:hypothetical protein
LNNVYLLWYQHRPTYQRISMIYLVPNGLSVNQHLSPKN